MIDPKDVTAECEAMYRHTAWQPMETVPKYEPVILFARHVDATASIPMIGWYSEDHGGWIAQCFKGQTPARIVPSFWMPRPAFPQ